MAHQFETVQFLPSPARERISGRARVLRAQRRASGMAADAVGHAGRRAEPVGEALFGSLRATEPRSASAQAAFSKYLDERSDREDARADRTHGAEGVIPTPLWIVLFVSAVILLGYMLFFADSGEGAIVQATMMGGVAVMVTSLLLLLWFLDNPYLGGGGLKPAAMQDTLSLLQKEASAVGAIDTLRRGGRAELASERPLELRGNGLAERATSAGERLAGLEQRLEVAEHPGPAAAGALGLVLAGDHARPASARPRARG